MILIRLIFAVMLISFIHAVMPEKDVDMNNQETPLTYYREYGVFTDPGKHHDLYNDVPDAIPDICRTVQGLLIHAYNLHLYDVKMSEERTKGAGIRKAEDMLGRILALDSSSLTQPRDPQNRMVGNCRNYALLMCSILKHKGIPARVRVGFATYFYPGFYEDHWICEYWSAEQEQWIKVDAQLDSVQANALKIDFDPLNVPEGKFTIAGTVYRKCEQGEIDPDKCGVGKMRGLWFVRGNLIRDLMALNRLEVLPWDGTAFMDVKKYPAHEISTQINTMISLTTSPADKLSEIRALYQNNPGLNWLP